MSDSTAGRERFRGEMVGWLLVGDPNEDEACPWVVAVFRTERSALAALRRITSAIARLPERPDWMPEAESWALETAWRDQNKKRMALLDPEWEEPASYRVERIPAADRP